MASIKNTHVGLVIQQAGFFFFWKRNVFILLLSELV